jgi:hypothetical protein
MDLFEVRMAQKKAEDAQTAFAKLVRDEFAALRAEMPSAGRPPQGNP